MQGSEVLLGSRHASVKRLRRLSRQRRSRSVEKAFVIDGPTLLAEALSGSVNVQEVFAEPEADPALVDRLADRGAVVRRLADGVLAGASEAVSPQPIAGVASFCDVAVDDALAVVTRRDDPLVLVLAGIGDPGNLGTLLRSAAAIGTDAVFCCDGTVDLYNPKVVRASAGALFHLRVVRDEPAAEVIAAVRAAGVRCYGGVARGGTDYDRADLTGPVALVLGSEAHGLSDDVVDRLDGRLTIPMAEAAESLNVGMAGTVLGFEARRQRRAARGEK